MSKRDEERGRFEKVVRLGRTEQHNGRGLMKASTFCKIKWDGTRLSISGVEGPRKNGDAYGGCGQIKVDPAEFLDFAPGWDAAQVAKFRETWDRWHLNDMRAGCEHQRAEGWNKRPIDPTQPLDTYGEWCGKGKGWSWNMLTWRRESECPGGLMCEPCPVCGYKYGTAWLMEEVPAKVVAYLQSLPDADESPAWV